MNRGSQSQLNRNKMTTLPPVSNLVKSRLEAASKNMSTNKKLRTELRRVMSDRVMKITKCSQQQTVEKINQLKAAPPVVPAPRINHIASANTSAANLTHAVLSSTANSNGDNLNKVSNVNNQIEAKLDEKKTENVIENNKSIVLQSIST